MTPTPPASRIAGLFLGSVAARWPGRPPSAIGKTRADGLQQITELGFTGDAQADPQHHGGPDKAIHHYPSDHYPQWMAEGQMPEGTVPAAFGENIAALGMTETNLCIGDILQLGTAVVQISQGRQPCWKVSQHTGNPKMAYLFQKTGRTGWYYRVLEPGQAEAGSAISLAERLHPDWSVGRLSRKATPQEAAALAQLPELAEGWRQAFARMAGGDTAEDTSARLLGS
ncbi:MOSC domain-containing protein (plasmid) [Leisingera aquaemixtae]|uniref:MOSC domain-containing protein n=1 Tax=Leisingera aquaemixtae TaxID=1396826 RepID=UPI0021A626F3|nr:MOSC domain-containing protein [Leisingera aquaemixtae]UWQ26830.1 MOSC domain-containing protein [Leisingera aquaemixtae]